MADSMATREKLDRPHVQVGDKNTPSDMEEPEKNCFMRQVEKSPAPFCYLRATLEYEGKGLETNALQFKHMVMRALTEVFGQIGASDTVDLLKLTASGDAILRVPSRCFVRLMAALTLFGKHNGKVCAFRVQQKSEDRVNPSQAILAYAWTEICYLHNVMKPLFYFFVPKYRTNFTQLLCHFK